LRKTSPIHNFEQISLCIDGNVLGKSDANTLERHSNMTTSGLGELPLYPELLAPAGANCPENRHSVPLTWRQQVIHLKRKAAQLGLQIEVAAAA